LFNVVAVTKQKVIEMMIVTKKPKLKRRKIVHESRNNKKVYELRYNKV